MNTKSFIYYKVFNYSLVAFLFVFGSSLAFGYEWNKTFGGVDDDYGKSVQQTTDGGYIIIGSALIKTDAFGNVLWSRDWSGCCGLGNDIWGKDVKQTTDGGYIVIARSRSKVGCPPGIPCYPTILYKMDSMGNETFSQYTSGDRVQQTTDGGYITIGSVALTKTDADGNELWRNESIGGNDVQQTTDGGYIVVGSELIKTDVDGNVEWNKGIGIPLPPAIGYDVQQTDDGGYIIAGDFGTPPGVVPGRIGALIKSDSAGDFSWWTPLVGDQIPKSIQQTTDGGYILAGSWDGDVFLTKTDNAGNILWTEIFGGTEDDEGNSVQQTTDGGYIVAGETRSFGAGGSDVYLVYYHPIDTTKEKTVTCKSDNWLMVAEDGGDENGDNILRSPKQGGLAQWYLIPDGDYYRIRLCGTEFYLSGEGPAGSIPNGRNIHLWTWADSDLQRWELIPDGSYYRLRCAEEDMYLSGSDDDSNIYLWQWVNGDLQRWVIQDYEKKTINCLPFLPLLLLND